MAVKTFGVWDYVVCGCMLAISAGIGIFFGCTGGKQKTTQEFLLANRQMSTLPVALSLLATFTSSLTILGVPSEVYTYGTHYVVMGLSYPLMCAFAGYVMVPVFFRLKLTSVFEYLEMRFHRSVRIFGAIFFIIQMLLYLSVVLYGPSLALSAVTGLNIWLSVCVVGLVCTFYTTIGGMKAVLWADVFQAALMFSGLIAIIIQGSINANGFTNIWRKAEKGGRIDLLNFDPDPTMRHTWWSLIIGGFGFWTSVFGANQASVQRAMTLRHESQLQRAFWLNTISLFAILVLTSMCGLVLYDTYGHCDPIKKGEILSSDQLLPLFVMEYLSFLPGLPGLLLSSIFSSSLSTISSGLNSLAAVTLRDFVLLICGKRISDARAATISKILAVIYGVLSLGVAYLASEFGALLTASISMWGIVGGPTFGLFVLGMLFPCANWIGALIGLLGGMVFSAWIGIGTRIYRPFNPRLPVYVDQCPIDNSTMNSTMSMMTSTMLGVFNSTTTPPIGDPRPKTIYNLSYMYYSLVTGLFVLVLGLLASALTACKKRKPVDYRLISPIFDICCCYFPKSWRESLHCGVDYSKKQDEAEDESVVVVPDSEMKGIDNPDYTSSEDKIPDKSPPASVDDVDIKMPPSYNDATSDAAGNEATKL